MLDEKAGMSAVENGRINELKAGTGNIWKLLQTWA